MKNNKGFTLVELLVVMVILASMSLIVVSGITASLDRRDDKECEEQIELAINAAKIYFSLLDGEVTDGTSVSIDTLRSSGYLEDSKSDRLSGGEIKLESTKYTYTGSCS